MFRSRHRVDLLDRPDVRGVGRAKESMSGSLAPAVKAPLVIAHEILAGEDRMFLDPNDRLAEVKANGLEHRRVVAAIGVAAPEIKGSSGLEHPRDVAEPGMEQSFDLLIGNEVIGQGPVLGT